MAGNPFASVSGLAGELETRMLFVDLHDEDARVDTGSGKAATGHHANHHAMIVRGVRFNCRDVGRFLRVKRKRGQQ